MSDPGFERDPDRRPTPAPTESRPGGAGSIWIARIVAALVLLGVVAYSYRDNITTSNDPTTTSGQMSPAPTTPPAAPANPAPRP
jgi:hypothetical protein